MRPHHLLVLLSLALSAASARAEEAKPETKSHAGMRGVRYCEVLLGGREGVHIGLDVYNTIGLNDCPQADWDALDAKALEKELKVSKVKLNGPRYWMIDRIENSKLLDPAVRNFGKLGMRKAGHLEVSPLELLREGKPYVQHDVRRDTIWVFEAGKRVYELVDPKGLVFDMQSYSVQTVPQTEDSLATLSERLKLPKGWQFRSRVLTEELKVKAVDGMAHVVQDDNGNTYQRSQQHP